MKPIIINNHNRTEEVYNKSIEFLNNNTPMLNEIGDYLWAYNEIDGLVPQTVENIWSGHFFPFSESYYELENSYAFCLEGFYRHSLSTLRSVLELATVGLYFDKENKAHIDIQEWLHAADRTPYFHKIVKDLFKLEYFAKINERLQLQEDIEALHSTLSNYVHVRGYKYSSSGKTISNFNQFNEKALAEYSKMMTKTVKYCITMIMAKYPIGMQVLPLWDKFGLNFPMGGLLDESSQDTIFKILDDKTKNVLQEISDNDVDVKSIVESINDMPNLTQEEYDQQNADYQREIKDHNINPADGI